VRHRRPLPSTQEALHRFRIVFWFLGLTFVAVGSVRLLDGQSVYMSISGAVFTPFLILLGLFFIAAAVLGRPKTRS
jgi:hypothetical protein